MTFRRVSRAPIGASLLALCLLAGPVLAQENSPVRQQSPVLIVDQDRLFAESDLGIAFRRRLESEGQALASESRRIENELRQEELDLTARRAELSPEDFTGLANAFDEKVQRLRTEQIEKSREFDVARDEAFQTFLAAIGPVLTDLVAEKGALVILDRRQVFLSVDAIDITDEAILRINRAVGEDDAED
ncbi:MAG: OmpH family outer membrane protein [Pseudomonadota bacterium]